MADSAAPPRNGRIKGNTMAAGTALGVVMTFAWDGLVPGYPMTPQMAVALPVLLGPAYTWLACWAPQPGHD